MFLRENHYLYTANTVDAAGGSVFRFLRFPKTIKTETPGSIGRPGVPGLEAEARLQLHGPATQRLAGYTEVRVRGYGSVGRDQSQICIDLSNVEICVVEQVVDVRADFKSRVLSQTSHLRQTKAFAQAGVDISVARAV